MKVFWVFIYNVLCLPILFLCFILFSIFKKKIRTGILGRINSLKDLKQYFNEIDSYSNIYWFHAASLGEFYQVKPIIEGMKEIDTLNINIVSFSSPSGYNHAKSESIDLKFFMPFDFFWTISKALKISKPTKVIFAAYDLWPNLIWISRYKGVHTNMFAARIKKNSIKLKPVVKNFYKNLYGCLSTIYTITKKDKELLYEIIGYKKKPIITKLGNPRYDMVKKTADQFTIDHTHSVLNREKRLIIGSSHVEDDRMLLPSISNLINTFPDLKILHAPHECSKSQIEKIYSNYFAMGFKPRIIKEIDGIKLPSDQIIILDLIGVLSKLYWQGLIAFIGGGMSTGIHNVMEPAIARLPVLFGPKYEHAPEAEELLNSGGGFCVTSQEEFESKINELLNDKDSFEKSSLAATNVIHKNLGSSSRIIRSLIRD